MVELRAPREGYEVEFQGVNCVGVNLPGNEGLMLASTLALPKDAASKMLRGSAGWSGAGSMLVYGMGAWLESWVSQGNGSAREFHADSFASDTCT